MTPTHTRKGGRLYRFYIAAGLLKGDLPPGVVRRVSAGEIEAAVVNQLRSMLRTPEIIIATWRAARTKIDDISEVDVREALEQLDPIWGELFPAEQARIVQLLVQRVEIDPEGMNVELHIEGLRTVVEELRPARERTAA